MGSHDNGRRVGLVPHLLAFVIETHVESRMRVLCGFGVVTIISEVAAQSSFRLNHNMAASLVYIRLSSAATRRLVDNPS